MTALKGNRADQLLALEGQVASLRRDLDLLQARPSAARPVGEVRLARIEGTPGPTDNTYSIMFLDGSFTETAGNQTPNYVNRQDTPSGFAHNLISSPATPPANGDIVIILRISGRWWFEWE